VILIKTGSDFKKLYLACILFFRRWQNFIKTTPLKALIQFFAGDVLGDFCKNDGLRRKIIFYHCVIFWRAQSISQIFFSV